VQNEERPWFGRQPSEPAIELVAVGDGQEGVGSGRPVGRQRPKIHDATSLARRLADADMDDELRQPGVEAIRIAEAPQVTPGDHQRILKGILGSIDISRDPVGDREEPTRPRLDQVDECRPIRALRRIDEISIHHRPRVPPGVGVVEPNGGWRVSSVHLSISARPTLRGFGVEFRAMATLIRGALLDSLLTWPPGAASWPRFRAQCGERDGGRSTTAPFDEGWERGRWCFAACMRL
jgi:hypothetical protein